MSNTTLRRDDSMPGPPSCIESRVGKFSSLSAQEVIELLENCARITVEQLLDAAALIYVAAVQGKDLRPVLVGFFKNAALVAFGQLCPEAVVQFSGRPAIISLLARLPSHEQAALMKAGSIEAAFLTDNGHDTRCVELKDLTPELARQVFGPHRLLTTNEQVAKLRADATRFKRLPGLPASVKIDRRHHQATIGGVVLRAGQLGAILAAIAGDA